MVLLVNSNIQKVIPNTDHKHLYGIIEEVTLSNALNKTGISLITRLHELWNHKPISLINAILKKTLTNLIQQSTSWLFGDTSKNIRLII